MDRTAALERLTRMTAAAEEPLLDGGQLGALLELAARPVGTDPDVATVWDLSAAAAEGWRWKLGKLTAPDFSADGASFNLQGARDVAKAMIAHYETAAGGIAAGGGGQVSTAAVYTHTAALREYGVVNAPEPVGP